MAADTMFENFDDKATYDRSLAHAQKESTHNFVIGFGQKEARIAFDISAGSIRELLKAERPETRPVLWMYV